MTRLIFLALCLILSLLSYAESSPYEIEDTLVSDCSQYAKVGDHLLFEFSFSFENGTSFGPVMQKPDQLKHILLDQGESNNHVHAAMKGMCLNSTRIVTWSEGLNEVDLDPILPSGRTYMNDIENVVSLKLILHHITGPEDYQIFDALKKDNISLALDLIDDHIGVNAVDEWGQTPLMYATHRGIMPLFAALLNARKPKIDVNIAKAVSSLTYIFTLQYLQIIS